MATQRPSEGAPGTGARIQNAAETALQWAILGSLLAGIRRRDPSVVINAVASLLFTVLPAGLEAAYGVRFRPWQRLWVSAAGLVHTLGMLGPYDRIRWWDDLAHTLSGVVVAAASDVVFRAERTANGSTPLPFESRAVHIASVTLGFGILWEALEYTVHSVADRLGFEPLLVHYGRLDAVGDVVFDLLGAGVVIRYGESTLSNLVETASEQTPDEESR